MRKIKRQFFIAAIAVCISMFSQLSAYAQSAIKVACVGNSITEGAGLEKTYPEGLQELLGEEYEVRNYGVGGRTLLKQGDFPYWNESVYEEALAWQPDIVIIKLGTNDTKPQNWQYKKYFVKDYKALVKSFQQLPSKPLVYVCYPLPVFEDKWGINEAALKGEVLPAIQKVARKKGVRTIDLYKPFTGQAHLTYDGIHPNNEGAALLAKEIYKALQLKGVATTK